MNETRRVGPTYFNDPDRDEAAEVGANLVNAFLSYDIELDSSNLRQVCDGCQPSKDAYRIDLGLVSLDKAREITEKLQEMQQEFQRLHDLTANYQVDAESAPDKDQQQGK